VEDDHSLNYARKAIKEITAIGKLRLEQKSNKTTEDGIVQVSDVSSSTVDAQSASEPHHEPDDADCTAEHGQPSSSSSSREVSSCTVGGPAAASDHSSVEEKCVASANEMDGLAICLT